MQSVLDRKQIKKWDLNELNPTSQWGGWGWGEKANEGGRKKDFKNFACFYYHSKGSLLSTSSPTCAVCCLLYNSHPDWCEVIAYCGFVLHFTDD